MLERSLGSFFDIMKESNFQVSRHFLQVPVEPVSCFCSQIIRIHSLGFICCKISTFTQESASFQDDQVHVVISPLLFAPKGLGD
jgi:hypothetical protein